MRTSDSPPGNEQSSERYHQLCKEYFNAEKQLDSISAIQHAIVDSLKHGASFRTSHKEGGTNIVWQGSRFVRIDYGDDPDEQHFTDESEFLKTLRKFFNSDVHCHTDKELLSEIDAWRLILRRLNRS